jgi:beta-lactamase superfamily II metal-dependent hydrolase
VHPQVVVLSVAGGDRRGLPDAETVAVLERYMLLRTDRDGWVKFSTDGERMWVETER